MDSVCDAGIIYVQKIDEVWRGGGAYSECFTVSEGGGVTGWFAQWYCVSPVGTGLSNNTFHIVLLQ